MEPEPKNMEEETLRLAQENNQMLRSMRRSMRFSHVMTFVYWIFILGSAIGAYYFIQPYLEDLVNVYGGAGSDILDSFK